MTRPTTTAPSLTGSLPSATERGSSRTRQARRSRAAVRREGRRGVPADEGALLEPHREAETGREGIGLARDVRPPDPVALLQPQRVDGPVAAGDEAVGLAGLHQRVPQAQPVLARRVQLPAELADVGDPQPEAGHVADGQRPGAEVAEAEVVAADVGEDVPGHRPPQAEAGHRRRDVADGDRARLGRGGGEVAPDPGEVVAAERRAGDDEEALLLEPGHREVALDPAAAC